jgi:hypothetical protein
MDKAGRFLQCGASAASPQPGPWKFNNFVHPDYLDYIEQHVRELFADYQPDGIFFDILFYSREGCWSESALKFRQKHGLLGDDAATWERFNGAAQSAFVKRFSKLVRGLSRSASIFYNAGNEASMDPAVGPRVREHHMSHLEIESLPSGFWGYYHFPRMARMQSHWGKPWLAQTARFQKMWGDFGGIKPQAALEFECFRTQALGGGNMVGDQLPPRGTLDAAAYRLIGPVYAQVRDAEPFYAGSTSTPDVAIYTASHPGLDGGMSEEGAVQMCEESHYDAMVCDSLSDLQNVKLVILPDTTVVTPILKKKLESFYKKGGKLILSYRSGFDASGEWALDFLPLSFKGEVEKFPTYWRVRPQFAPQMAGSDRVIYQAGMNARGGSGTSVLVERVLPYFKRSDLQFSSHFQTPPVAKSDRFPAVIGGERFVYFADPIFREYRQTGNLAVRDGWKLAVLRLIGAAPFGEGLPTTMLVYPRRRGSDLLLSLLHYIPVRKAIDIDVLEDRSSFAGEQLYLSGNAAEARIFQGELLGKDESGAFVLPPSKGRLLIEVPGYYREMSE